MSPADRFIALHERNPTAEQDARWYEDAAADCRARARAAGIPPRRYAAIVAATSPCNSWRTKSGATPNLDMADRMVAGDFRGLPWSLDASRRILAGAQPTKVLGQKTSAFYLNLTGRDAVTIDRWIIRATGLERDSVTPKQYDELADAVRQAAERLGIPAHALQASVWTQIKRESEAS